MLSSNSSTPAFSKDNLDGGRIVLEIDLSDDDEERIDEDALSLAKKLKPNYDLY